MAQPLPQSSSPSTRRQALVDTARDLWVRRLIDLSRRNPLLFYRPLKTGTLDLTNAEPRPLQALLNGQSSALSRLVPREQLVRTVAQARSIRRRAVANREEKGIETLFLALGLATWTPSDGGRAPAAPVVLLPVSVELSSREGDARLQRSGDPQANLTLLHVLEHEYGRPVSVEWLLEDVDEPDEALDPSMVASRLLEVARAIPGFAITPAVVLGNFSFQKLALVTDLRAQGTALVANDMIAALAGDSAAHQAILSTRTPIEPRSLDSVPPEQEFLILDADSSQQAVIAAVVQGQTGVIEGPPGTGKSQTIANLIATLAAQGKRVLFVAEKRAALEVVLRRLEQSGLGHLALDLHGAEISRRELAQRFAASLSHVRDAGPVDTAALHRSFQDRRTRLNEHVVRLHGPRAPSGLSVFELQGRLLRFPAHAAATTRWRGAELLRITAENAALVHDLLIEAGGFGDLLLGLDPSPWTPAQLRSGAEVQEAGDLLVRLSQTHLPALRAAARVVDARSGLRAAASLHDLVLAQQLLAEVAETLGRYQPAVFGLDLDALIAALAPANMGTLRAAWGWLWDAAYRAAYHSGTQQRRSRPASGRALLGELATIVEQQRRWQERAASAQTLPDAEGVRESLDALAGLDLATVAVESERLAVLLGRPTLALLALDELGPLVDALLADTRTPPRLPPLIALRNQLVEHGVARFLDELRTQRPPVESWPERFDQAWLASCLAQAHADDPGLAGFNGAVHSRFAAEFSTLDREHIQLAAARVRRAHAEKVIAVMNTHPTQEALVRRETEKKTRHLPLRKLLPQAAEVLTTLCPCWMASPLSVSQLIPADRYYFDVVIFDEASQVLPEDAVASLLRASAVVVAGDQRQLPPTTFFAAGEDEEAERDEEPSAAGFESLLDLMTAFLEPWPLRWHYRSRDESLIAFANAQIYDNRLVTFPGPNAASTVSHVLVPFDPELASQQDSAWAEVRRVVELVFAHAEQHADETLGVIALGISHAQRIEAALDEALRARPDLDAFFDQAHSERFFVKNLERVQGDERDAIILSIGYGKDRNGRLVYRFGPLLTQGGERRLNVAITRARKRMTVVSSFAHTDMQPGRSQARGVELLRLYLQYAAGGGRLPDTALASNRPPDPLEADIYEALVGAGLPLLARLGASQYRIDFAAPHRDQQEAFALAIECDGNTYRAAPTARDRDRLRQQHLEALGWRYLRIWSLDWVQRREDEIARVLRAYQAAIAADAAAERQDQPLAGVDATATRTLVAPEPAAAMQTRTQARHARPAIPQLSRIDDYKLFQLIVLIRWIRSDGRLRSDDEILDEMVRELGFKRRGPRIEAALRAAIAQERHSASENSR